MINSFYAQKFEGLIKNINKKDQISKEQLNEKSFVLEYILLLDYF